MRNQQGNILDKGSFSTWLVVLSLAGGFVGWGFLIFYAIGTHWPPAWDFGQVDDVPGQSAYSTNAKRPIFSVVPSYLHEEAELVPQHVKDKPGEETTTKNKEMSAP